MRQYKTKDRKVEISKNMRHSGRRCLNESKLSIKKSDQGIKKPSRYGEFPMNHSRSSGKYLFLKIHYTYQ